VPNESTNGGDPASSDQFSHTASGAPATPGAAAVAPIQPAPAPAPVKSGPSALKIILIVVAVFIGLGILSLGAVGFIAWRIAHSVHMTGPNGDVSISMPGGSITANTNQTYTAEDLGTDVYPGATAAKGGMKMTLPTGSSVTAIFTTSDSKDQVVSFYKGKLGSDATTMDMGTVAILTVKKGDQEQVNVTVTANPSENGGKTQISITHTIETKPS
jgi:hypothetical protein